ncbi:MAG: hypothetical protein ACPGSP_03215 [Alphaproteobacteria bacterium]
MATPKIDNQAAFSDVGWNLNYFMGLAILVNVITVATIAFSSGGLAIYVPLTAVIVFMNVLAIIGLNATMDDARSVLQDLSEEEQKSHRYQNWLNAPWIFYRVIITVGFAAALLAQLWSMYMA